MKPNTQLWLQTRSTSHGCSKSDANLKLLRVVIHLVPTSWIQLSASLLSHPCSNVFQQVNRYNLRGLAIVVVFIVLALLHLAIAACAEACNGDEGSDILYEKFSLHKVEKDSVQKSPTYWNE